MNSKTDVFKIHLLISIFSRHHHRTCQ